LLAATVNASSAGCRAKGLTAPASDGRPVDAANKEGRTALMFAAKYGQRDVAAYLLDEAAADPTLRMKNESSAFDWCANPHYAFLTSRTSEDLPADDASGLLPIPRATALTSSLPPPLLWRRAVFGGHRPTMDLLANHPRVDVAALNRFGCAAVQWAAAAGNVESCKWLQARARRRRRQRRRQRRQRRQASRPRTHTPRLTRIPTTVPRLPAHRCIRRAASRCTTSTRRGTAPSRRPRGR